MNKTVALAVSLFGIWAMAQEMTPADERFEDRIARIYKQYDQKEISNEEWDKIAGEKSTETYSLQGGDSLWDISQKFFGNGFYWPKVWQLNDKITNPHLIKVGNNLRFSGGTDVAPPSLDVEQNLTESAPTTDDDSAGTKTVMESSDAEALQFETEESPGVMVKSEVTIPSGRRSIAPLKEIPPSFPEWRGSDVDFDENGFAKDSVVPKVEIPTTLLLNSLINDAAWSSNGVVSEMEGTQGVAANYQTIIVKLNIPAKKGDVFTVFQNAEEVADPDTREVVGQEILVKGLVKIVEPMQGESDTYLAMVTKAVRPIMIDDELQSGNHLIKAATEVAGTHSNVAAKIVDGQETGRSQFQLHDIVFLNRGEKDGLQVGSLLDVLKNYRARNKDSKVTFDTEVIGKLRVATVGQSVATAVVVRLNAAILPGDETSFGPEGGSPSKNSGSSPEEEFNDN